MTSPSWRKLAHVKIDAKPDSLWGLVLQYVPGSRLLRFRVVDQDDKGAKVPVEWEVPAGTKFGADGSPNSVAKSAPLCSSAPLGALIAKIGGSTADLPDATTPTVSYTNKKVFGVGSFCVVSLGATDGGPLYLTMNDSPDGFTEHSGALWVLIDECPS